MRRLLLVCVALCLVETGLAQEVGIRIPESVVAGNSATVSTTGNGKATFYLVGPDVARKEEVVLGRDIIFSAEDLQRAGAYLVIVCSGTCQSKTFYVSDAKPVDMSFLVHPSRVPVSLGDSISGVAFPFDRFHNLVLSPVTINFQLFQANTSLLSRPVRTQNGVAWFRTTSGKSAGALQVVATVEGQASKRVVQQVASDPCNLRITGQRTSAGILVQTEPVRDCAGNPVSDGTIVTFSASEANQKSTVDAPIKQGIAKANIPIDGSKAAVISVASGVVMGNELRIGAQP